LNPAVPDWLLLPAAPIASFPRKLSPAMTLLPALAALAVLSVALLRAVRQGRGERHRRGALVRRGPRAPWRARWSAARTDAVVLGGVPIALWEETRHFKLIGTTGAGKSTAIGRLLEAALRRGDRAIVSDPGGSYLRRLGRRYRGDLLLNPFEPDSVRWDLFGELRCDFDADQLASALIPDGADASANEWRGYARTFLASLLRSCRRESKPRLEQLWRLLAVADTRELRALVRQTPAQPLLAPGNERMFASIRAVAASALAGLPHVQRQRATSLSVRDWVRQGRGVLFFPYQAGQIAALRGLLAAWLRLAIFEALDGPEDVDQRLWFVIDELDALGPVDGLKDALARLRKHGGRCVLALQSIAQISGNFGHSQAQTITENCGNTLIFRCAGSEHGGTAQFAARLIGEREVLRRHSTRGRDHQGLLAARALRRSVQISEQPQLESAVLASELEQLPDLTGYLKTAASGSWRRVRLAPD
jgi:type IV secretory pathway TraG/TraD family ATPase VirD4